MNTNEHGYNNDHRDTIEVLYDLARQWHVVRLKESGELHYYYACGFGTRDQAVEYADSSVFASCRRDYK